MNDNKEFVEVKAMDIVPRVKRAYHRKSYIKKDIVIATDEEKAAGFANGLGQLQKNRSPKNLAKIQANNNNNSNNIDASITSEELRKAANEHLPEPYEVMLFKSLAKLKVDFDNGENTKEYIKLLEVVSKILIKPKDPVVAKKADTSQLKQSILDGINDMRMDKTKSFMVDPNKIKSLNDKLNNRLNTRNTHNTHNTHNTYNTDNYTYNSLNDYQSITDIE